MGLSFLRGIRRGKIKKILCSTKYSTIYHRKIWHSEDCGSWCNHI